MCFYNVVCVTHRPSFAKHNIQIFPSFRETQIFPEDPHTITGCFWCWQLNSYTYLYRKRIPPRFRKLFTGNQYAMNITATFQTFHTTQPRSERSCIYRGSSSCLAFQIAKPKRFINHAKICWQVLHFRSIIRMVEDGLFINKHMFDDYLTIVWFGSLLTPARHVRFPAKKSNDRGKILEAIIG